MMMDAQDDQLSVEAAGRVVGISPRTLRSWIVHGKLPATGGQRGKLVRLADVIALAREDSDARTLVGEDNHNGSVANGADVALPESPPSARNPFEGFLEELRDGVIWPLAERVEMLAREHGRLVTEHAAAVRERDELAARFTTDNRFVDRLVELLQNELDAAHRRIAELEEQLAKAPAPATPAPAAPKTSAETPPVTRGLGRRRLGPLDPVEPPTAEEAPLFQFSADAPEQTSLDLPPATRPWWKPWKGR